jgi:signal transduction histidine kinase
LAHSPKRVKWTPISHAGCCRHSSTACGKASAGATEGSDHDVSIRIRDTGAGIPQELRDRVFTPFFTTKPPGEGTGLGLSLAYDIIVKQHGGKIAFDSDPGSFTEFVVTLPRVAPDARP